MHGVMSAIYAIQLESGHANVTFRPVGYDKIEATRAALDLVQEARVHAVIGGGSSSISSVAQLSFALAGVPQVGYSATSALLSDRVAFPTFSRVVPPDTFQGASLAHVCAHLGWRRLAVVSTNDEYGSDLARVFVGKLRELGGNELVDRSIPLSTNMRQQHASINETVQAVRRSRARIVALFAGSVGAARMFMAEGWRAGLRVWYIGTDSWMLTSGFASAISQDEDERLAAYAAEGALGTAPLALRSGPDYERFLSHWRAAPGVASHPELACDASCRTAEPSWAGQYAYDATRRVHRAWTAVIASGGGADPRNLSSGALLRAIRAVDLPHGLVSNSSLDAKTGEPRDGTYDLVQLSGSLSSSGGSGSSRLLQIEDAALDDVDSPRRPVVDVDSSDLSTRRRLSVQSRPIGRVTGSKIWIDSVALQFGASLPAGSVPQDGTHASASQSLIELGPWQRTTPAELVEVPIAIKDSFGDALTSHNAPTEACTSIQVRISHLGYANGTHADAFGSFNATQADSDPAISPQLDPLGYYHNDSSLCSVRIQAPLQTGAYEVHVLLGGQALANCPVALDVVPARWVELATSLLGSLVPVALVALVLACYFRRLLHLRKQQSRQTEVDPESKEVLALFCNPRLPIKMQQAFGVSPLALGQDLKHLLRAMPSSTVAIEPAATLADAQAAFRKHQPRVLIFSGHTIGGKLAFEDARGRLDAHAEDEITKVVSGKALQQEMKIAASAASAAAIAAKPVRPAWFGGKPLPKGRQPGELAGWTAMMGAKAHAKEMEQSMALKAAHGFVRGLRSRDEAIAHLRRMNRRDVARSQLGLVRRPGDSVLPLPLATPELAMSPVASPALRQMTPPSSNGSSFNAADENGAEGKRKEEKGSFSPAKSANSHHPLHQSLPLLTRHRRSRSSGPATAVPSSSPKSFGPKAAASATSSLASLASLASLGWGLETRYGQRGSTSTPKGEAVVHTEPPQGPRLSAAVDDSQLELRSHANEWKQLASWGGFRRAHVVDTQKPREAAGVPSVGRQTSGERMQSILGLRGSRVSGEEGEGKRASKDCSPKSVSSASADRARASDARSPGGQARPPAVARRASHQQRQIRRLESVVLCGCSTEPIGRKLLLEAPHLEVVCWATIVEDSAARAFSLGVYRSLAETTVAGRSKRGGTGGGRSDKNGVQTGANAKGNGDGKDGSEGGIESGKLSRWEACERALKRCGFCWKPQGRSTPEGARSQLEVAFWAGCNTFATEGFRCGDPRDYLHRDKHPHLEKPEFSTCTGCSPPVQGLPILLRMSEDGEVTKVSPEPYVPPASSDNEQPVEQSSLAEASETHRPSRTSFVRVLTQTLPSVATSGHS